MRQVSDRSLLLGSPDATTNFASRLERVLTQGDTILLDGPIGSGKTHFCRAFIQARLARLGAPLEDIPSPTFTLVQTYDVGETEIWHADLYRLMHPDEVEELGLFEAFSDQICLVEWPDRLGDLAPENALKFTFSSGPGDEDRSITISTPSLQWAQKLDPILAEFPNV